MDPMIDLLYERIKVIYVDILTQNQHDAEVRFKSILNRRFNMRELRGVGVKFMSAVTRLTKRELIQNIWEYFSTHIHLPENEPIRLPVQPDPIPEFAQDLEQQQDDEEEDITWYMDRTPTRVTAIPTTPQAPRITQRYLDNNTDSLLQPRNLYEAFSATVRKFNIIPTLLVQEDENLEECDDCPICYESVKILDSVEMGCSHKFCGECVTQTLKKHNKREAPCCALCRGKIERCVVKKQEVYDKIVEYCNL